MVERAYNRTARMAARTQRSRPALEQLKWPTWEEKRESALKKFVNGVYERKQPEALFERFPKPQQGAAETRAMKRGELEEPGTRTYIGEKSFSIWAARVLNESKREVEQSERRRDAE